MNNWLNLSGRLEGGIVQEDSRSCLEPVHYCDVIRLSVVACTMVADTSAFMLGLAEPCVFSEKLDYNAVVISRKYSTATE